MVNNSGGVYAVFMARTKSLFIFKKYKGRELECESKSKSWASLK